MTAKEARNAAIRFNSIENDTVYQKINELIEQTASQGKYFVFANISSYDIDLNNNPSHYYPLELRMRLIFEKLCNNGYNLSVKIYKQDGTRYEIKIDWGSENETGSIKYV